MSKHTPGPWRADTNPENVVAVYCSGDDTVAVCDENNYPDSVCEANARLVAAAPDLLAALEAVLAAWLRDANEGDGIMESDEPALLAARAAIARAKGGAT